MLLSAYADSSISARTVTRLAKYLQIPAKWYQELTRERREAEARDDYATADAIEVQREREIEYLKDSIKLLRRFAKGFTAADGFDLNNVALIPQKQIDRVKKYAPILRTETSNVLSVQTGEPVEYYKVVRPRTHRGREALEHFTGQTAIPNRTGYVVPVDRPGEEVRLVSKEVVTQDKLGRRRHAKQTQVEVTEIVGEQKFYNRYFRFEAPPVTFSDVIDETRQLLKFMPKGWYVMETSNHGAIYAPMRKEAILQELHDFFLGYDQAIFQGKDNRGLAETVLGYRLIGYHQTDAERFYNERTTRRLAFRKFRQQRRAAQRRRILRRLGRG